MTNQKYVSRIGLERNYAYAPGHYFRLDWQKIQDGWPDPECWLVALDDRQIDLILNLLTVFPKYYVNWGLAKDGLDQALWDEISAFVASTEHCLMAGCSVELLIKSNLLVAAALSGDSVDLDQDLDVLMAGVKDYASIGLSPQFVANSGANLADVTENLSDQQSLDLGAIKTAIDNLELAAQDIKAAIEAGQDLEDDLANVWNAVSAVATILGGTVGVPPIPL